jgi:4-hydroxybenzoate polyprenyltransferase
MLRVFDEHKDYASDCVAHPGRVLQRGVVTLRHLKSVGAVAISTGLGASILADGGAAGPVTRAWLLTFGWSLLMAKEFFVREWLRGHLVVYALTHMIVMPLAVHWLVRMGAGGAPLPAAAWMLPLTSYLTGFAFEIARKLKAPADERPDVDSYTRAFGTRRAPLVLAILLTAASGGFVAMLHTVIDHWIRIPAAGVLGASLLAAWVACLRFRNRPEPSHAKACEKMTGLVVGLCHIVLVLAIAIAPVPSLLHRSSRARPHQPCESPVIHFRVVTAIDGNSREETDIVECNPAERTRQERQIRSLVVVSRLENEHPPPVHRERRGASNAEYLDGRALD